MKITKKIISVLLAAILLVYAAMISAYAAPETNGYPGGITITQKIDRIDITLRTDVAGMSAWDYKTIYTIETEHVKYHDNGWYSDVPAMGIYDKNGNYIDYNQKLVMGESYQFCFYLVADPLYRFSDNVKVYVNGKIPEHYSFYFGEDSAIGNVDQQYMNFTDKDWHTVTLQPGACKYCSEIHSSFFGSIVGFFHSILALFGMHK
ncbi:MAG: hypothetical protein IJU45_08950 [Clostridia bacterium]|nr:hypothetical protein [Clostridia bacterium]